MSPKVAECGEIARQKLKTARECWEKGAFERAARESRNAVCAGCVAVGLGGFGDPWSTFEKASHLGSNRQHPVFAAEEMLLVLNAMLPEGDAFPEGFFQVRIQ